MRYPIGTRVRNIATTFTRNKRNIGREGVIIDRLPASHNDDYEMSIDGSQSPGTSGNWGCKHDHLEPITKYDGNQLSTWDEVLNDTGWQPGKVTA